MNRKLHNVSFALTLSGAVLMLVAAAILVVSLMLTNMVDHRERKRREGHLPPPDTTAKVTGTFATGVPPASRTSTAGGWATWVATAALWPSPAAIATDAGAPTPSETGVLMAGAYPEAAKIRVRDPGAPTRARSVYVTMPLASLVRVVVPRRLPSPVAI